MFLDERRFQDERFSLVVGDNNLDVGNLVNEFFGFDAVAEVAAPAGLKIRTHTISQVFGFADVYGFSVGVFMQIDAGRPRDFFEFLFESHFTFDLQDYLSSVNFNFENLKVRKGGLPPPADQISKRG